MFESEKILPNIIWFRQGNFTTEQICYEKNIFTYIFFAHKSKKHLYCTFRNISDDMRIILCMPRNLQYGLRSSPYKQMHIQCVPSQTNHPIYFLYPYDWKIFPKHADGGCLGDLFGRIFKDWTSHLQEGTVQPLKLVKGRGVKRDRILKVLETFL